ncbi:hypothetical protein [[Flexibacter] sp. ATCC 35208]|uniref:hypothetical protein n=1 Tax=[Flexibacter] sp. ATCC 35208 TaxID=1936242 RepID=UPI0009D0EEB5|nr:hypothetical protein [[Flexibacter] sp. ATCC 35208]OMP75443.1 hypothetical protein BW716_30035 [[Flexibacter] sp. ATCC 35208]
MKRTEQKPHLILKKFNNSGGEGELTKIITEENESNYALQLKGLPEDEKGLVIYKKDEDNWVLITKRRIRFARNGEGHEIMVADFDDGHFCWDSPEARRSQFILTDMENNKYLLDLEKGNAFSSMTSVMFFMAQQ